MTIEKIVTLVLFVAIAFVMVRCLWTAWKIEKDLKKLEALLKKWKQEDEG